VRDTPEPDRSNFDTACFPQYQATKMMKNLTLKEKLLPQPPSFNKKTHYEIHGELGAGTFGKVMVRSLC
jgi:hypothetical protein